MTAASELAWPCGVLGTERLRFKLLEGMTAFRLQQTFTLENRDCIVSRIGCHSIPGEVGSRNRFILACLCDR